MRITLALLLAAPVLLAASGTLPASLPPAASDDKDPDCTIDLEVVPMMRDVLSNALMHAFKKDGLTVTQFLNDTTPTVKSSASLVKAAAARFNLTEEEVKAAVERYHHVNCSHPHEPILELEILRITAGEGDPLPHLTDFASDVIFHVVLHELAHALVREFDLPILGNE